MRDANPSTIYSGKFVAKEKLDRAEAKLAELDNMLVVSHLGTLDSFESVAHAVRALVEFDLSAEKYFAGQQLAELREAVKEAYFDGWYDSSNSTSVTGDPTPDWDESDAKAELLQEKGE